MNTIKIHQLADEPRSVIRPVALTYPRARRAGLHDYQAFQAALAEYRRLVPEPAAGVDVPLQVSQIIAAAIGADVKWFWDGPDV